MASSRTLFIAVSLGVHAAFAVGIGELEVKKSRAATAIQIAEAKKPAKKPEPPKVEPPPSKPEPPARERRASAPKPAAPPPEAAPPPAATPAVSDLPDFGVSLSGGVDGTGIALPVGNSARTPSAAAERPAKPAVKQLAPAAPAAVDACEDPPAKPKPRSVPQAAYTEAARAAAVEGKVRVQLTVDETGAVVDVKLLQGLGYGLDEAALAAARLASFEPAVRCGKPTRATFTISMRFTL